MPGIERPNHTLPTAHRSTSSHPKTDPVTEEEDEDSDDGCTLFDLKRKRGVSTSQKGISSPGGEIFPAPPKKPRMAARKCKATASADDNDNDKHPMQVSSSDPRVLLLVAFSLIF
jgi:hypothetical protein